MVNAAGVFFSQDIWLKNCLVSSVLDLPPVQVGEEGMRPDIIGVINLVLRFEAANSFFRVFGQQHFQKRFGVGTQIRFPRNFFVDDITKHLLPVVFMVMWRSPAKHLVHQGS
jgi:hypothetical protein